MDIEGHIVDGNGIVEQKDIPIEMTTTPAPDPTPTSTGSLLPYEMSSDGIPYDTLNNTELSYHLTGLVSNKHKAESTDPELDKQKIAYIKKLMAKQNTK